MKSEHQKETAFLRQVIRYDDTKERYNLEERITRAQGGERTVRRAIWLMVLLIALSVAGLCYWVIFVMDDPQTLSQFVTPFSTKVLCEVGLGSLICVVAFLVVRMVYRKKLRQLWEEGRRMATRFMESRLGKADAPKGTAPEILPKESNGRSPPPSPPMEWPDRNTK